MDRVTPYFARAKEYRPVANKKPFRKPRSRQSYTDEFKAEAVQMMVDGHSAASVAERLGISQVNLLYRWKALAVSRGGPAAKGLDIRVNELQEELRRVERERDILKKALSILSRNV